MSDMLEAVEEIVEMLEPSLLPVDKLGALVDKLAGILADSSKRRAERLKRLEGEDFDEDEALAIEALNLPGRMLYCGGCVGIDTDTQASCLGKGCPESGCSGIDARGSIVCPASCCCSGAKCRMHKPIGMY